MLTQTLILMFPAVIKSHPRLRYLAVSSTFPAMLYGVSQFEKKKHLCHDAISRVSQLLIDALCKKTVG